MTRSRLMAAILAVAIAGSPAMTLAQQATGLISGKASRQFEPRYTDYKVQIRDVATGTPVLAKPLDADGRFAFPDLALNERYLVELFQTRQNVLVCTEGPFALVATIQPQKTNVTIECGKTPAILWLLAAGAGTAAAVSVANVSPSR